LTLYLYTRLQLCFSPEYFTRFLVISLLRFATELAAALDDAIGRVPAQRRKHTLVVARPAKQEAK